ncbi:YggT family protein [Erythrobacteraceae bacterium CFH 75059]|uniref:YggT family protein n=1 Tax=Qipengyuania thermophila TaxID=2509361 RepID=UPI00102038F0|nr:YggT family protein [Qipengyuania thermophila]TCD06475.1 YggT family protein [Erythrobacteraceae bacterium CFH 75059]
MTALIQIVSMLINVLVMLVIVQFIIGLLFAFNVINRSNEFMAQVYQSINALLDPVLAPIRRILPGTGAIDFSPLVLILLLNALLIILRSMAAA